jgi:AcrR family transcriptional regulator
MQSKSEQENPAGDDPTAAAGTPRGELARQRRRRSAAEAQVREQILGAMLAACGELGYREVTIKHIYQRYGGHRVEFYRHFANKAECYAIAYELEVERLWQRLMRGCEAAGSWAEGLRAALAELAAYISEDSLLASGLLVEARVAPGPVRTKRTEVLERLARAIDGARRESTASRHSPPPITASFIVCAIEESVVDALVRDAPERFAAAVPALRRLAECFYFGEQAGTIDDSEA